MINLWFFVDHGGKVSGRVSDSFFILFKLPAISIRVWTVQRFAGKCSCTGLWWVLCYTPHCRPWELHHLLSSWCNDSVMVWNTESLPNKYDIMIIKSFQDILYKKSWWSKALLLDVSLYKTTLSFRLSANSARGNSAISCQGRKGKLRKRDPVFYPTSKPVCFFLVVGFSDLCRKFFMVLGWYSVYFTVWWTYLGWTCWNGQFDTNHIMEYLSSDLKWFQCWFNCRLCGCIACSNMASNRIFYILSIRYVYMAVLVVW